MNIFAGGRVAGEMRRWWGGGGWRYSKKGKQTEVVDGARLLKDEGERDGGNEKQDGRLVLVGIPRAALDLQGE